jgi:hypothetical protein
MWAMTDEFEELLELGPGDVTEVEVGPEDVTEVGRLPALVEARVIDRPSSPLLPAVQAAAAAITGFVAGAATLALVRRRNARRLARVERPAPVGYGRARTYLVHIRVLD